MASQFLTRCRARIQGALCPSRRDPHSSGPLAPIGYIAEREDETSDTEQADPFNTGHDLGFQSGGEVAFAYIAGAWIDRWHAAGGSFGIRYDTEGQFSGIMIGRSASPDFWTPTDKDRPDLPPHLWLYEDEHMDGALRALDGMLQLCPRLREAVGEKAAARLLGPNRPTLLRDGEEA
jgi:hypothetical protein